MCYLRSKAPRARHQPSPGPALGNIMKKKILKPVIGVLVLLSLLTAGGAIWACSHGYYHAMRGGLSQNQNDLDNAIYHFTIAYEENPETFMVAHDLACCYALKGNNDSCFHWLRLALKSHYADYARNYAKTEHDFDAVRQTAEFQSLIYDTPPKQPGTP